MVVMAAQWAEWSWVLKTGENEDVSKMSLWSQIFESLKDYNMQKHNQLNQQPLYELALDKINIIK